MWSEIVRFFSMAAMLFNICNQNDFSRKQCLTDMDKWLLPELVKAWELKTQQTIPYQDEKDKLQSPHGPNTTL